VLADWAAPILRGLTLEIDHPDVEAAGRRVSQPRSGVSAIDLGDLPAGRAIWVSGRLSGYRGESRTFRLVSADRDEVTEEFPGSDRTSAAGARPAIAALFGARRVLELELASSSAVGLEKRLRQLGYDPDQVLGQGANTGSTPPPIYAENARSQAADAVRALLVREALHYGIACSETAFVATRREAGQRIDGTVAVANALPSGWSSDFLMARTGIRAGKSTMMNAMLTPMAMAPQYAPPPGQFAQPPSGPMAPGPTPVTPQMAPGMLPPVAPMQSFGSSGPTFDLGTVADAATGFFRRLRGSSPSPRVQSSAGRAHESVVRDTASGLAVLFAGVPSFVGQEAVLFDSTTSSGQMPGGSTLSRLVVRFLDGGPVRPIDPGLTLLVFVDDLSSPRAQVRLADLVRQGGERPLNIQRQPGQVIRIVLQDAHGTWASSAPRLEVRLG
jgi:Ca-activated chloride channel family protein